MKKLQPILKHEVFKYLVAGVLATIFYLTMRLLLYPILNNGGLTAAIANVLAITFAFFVNDSYVFEQQKLGWQNRFVKFFLARLSTLALDFGLTLVLVDLFPHLIGQFVNNNSNLINAIAGLIGQVLIMVTNYFISKIFVFKK